MSMTWQEALSEAEEGRRATTTDPAATELDYLDTSLHALIAIARQGEASLAAIERASAQAEQAIGMMREMPDMRFRIEGLNAALQLFGSTLRLAAETEKSAALAELLGYAEAFAGFLAAGQVP